MKKRILETLSLFVLFLVLLFGSFLNQTIDQSPISSEFASEDFVISVVEVQPGIVSCANPYPESELSSDMADITQTIENSLESDTQTIENSLESDITIEAGYNEDDADLLAHLIYAEVGCDWISDETLYYAGSVVLNRVASDRFPNTIREVIYAPGQYECTWNGTINQTPSQRCYDIAIDLLKNGSVLPEGVFGQCSEQVYKNFNMKTELYCIKDTQYFFYF